jgi:hypothetical protein
MTAASAITGNCAKVGGDDSVGKDRRGRRLNENVMRISRDLFPVKTSQYLAEITGYSVRACERWLSESVVIPSDALAALLHCEKGREFLAAVMTDNTPRWWLQLKAWARAVDYRAAEMKQRRVLRELLDDAAATLTNSPAFLIQDEDFYRGQPAPHGALAPRRKR